MKHFYIFLQNVACAFYKPGNQPFIRGVDTFLGGFIYTEGNFRSLSFFWSFPLVFFKPTDVMPNFALTEQTEVIGSF